MEKRFHVTTTRYTMRFVINVAISCRRGNYVELSEIPFEITLVSRTEQSNSCRDSAMSASMHPSCSDSSWFYIFNNVSGPRDIKLRTLTLITPSCFCSPSSFRRLFHNLPVIPFEIATICFVRFADIDFQISPSVKIRNCRT